MILIKTVTYCFFCVSLIIPTSQFLSTEYMLAHPIFLFQRNPYSLSPIKKPDLFYVLPLYS